jgi:HSP20 family molecular chaperone IbpA
MTTSQALEVREKKELETKGEKTIPVRHFVPAADIFETEDALTLVMEMPGVEKKDLDVQVENDVLRVEGRIDAAKYQGLTPLYSEYNVGHFTRAFSLSSKIDASRINATVQDGVLTLKLPKAEEARPRRIPIG